jgi:beta-glucosidase
MDDPGNVTVAQGVHDATRVAYYRSYISKLKEAIDGGANCVGYFAWSLLDNFEWKLGYTSRFGLVYVDFKTLRRYPKSSAYWFRDVITGNN